MPSTKRVPGSLRSEGGIATLGIDKPTKAKLRELAGDMPMSHYVRGLVFGYIKPAGSAQESLPGQERQVSPATIHSVAYELSELRANTATREDYNKLELLISDVLQAMGINNVDTGTRRMIRKANKSVRSVTGGQKGSQSELKLA